MNSYDIAQQTGMAAAQKASYTQSAPQYGGDCALQEEAGVTTSVKRLAENVAQLSALTWQLREYFGMSIPETNAKQIQSNGLKGVLDELGSSVGASLQNVTIILEHLRS
jgi:hypothetical protein